MKRILFIDPGSHSAGWAIFKGKELEASGTLTMDRKLKAPHRLGELYRLLNLVTEKFGAVDEVHIERLNHKTSYICLHSVGVIEACVANAYGPNVVVEQDISPGTWQKAVEWKSDMRPLRPYRDKVGSLDELAAIGIGLYWVGRESDE